MTARRPPGASTGMSSRCWSGDLVGATRCGRGSRRYSVQQRRKTCWPLSKTGRSGRTTRSGRRVVTGARQRHGGAAVGASQCSRDPGQPATDDDHATTAHAAIARPRSGSARRPRASPRSGRRSGARHRRRVELDAAEQAVVDARHRADAGTAAAVEQRQQSEARGRTTRRPVAPRTHQPGDRGRPPVEVRRAADRAGVVGRQVDAARCPGPRHVAQDVRQLQGDAEVVRQWRGAADRSVPKTASESRPIDPATSRQYAARSSNVV